ncbi:origin recognition complex subunit 3 N-terminus-domain-containing protein [Infundibulicybe gibba]|nr:origin recognition complex subunit 3 N-terminus-domain-containing protein [Infundibulicybe gibba]
MSEHPNLDDANQASSVFFIPHTPDHGGDGETTPSWLFQSESDRLCFKAYEEAWSICLNRMQEIINELYTPVVDAVVERVHTSHSTTLPGLPFPEIPVITINDPAYSSMLLTSISAKLDPPNDDGTNPLDFVVHLYASECGNIASGMKTIVTGFTDQALENTKRRPTHSLANHDIEYLKAWYTALQDTYDGRPNLVLILHEFEQFDPTVMQDIFYICSLHIDFLPFVFILSHLSPPSPSYIHQNYPRSTLTLLDIHNIAVPSSFTLLEDILANTFFDVHFEPKVMMGPATLISLIDHFARYNASIDGVLTILQLAHLKHFMTNPLTFVVHATPSPQRLSEPASFPLLDALFTRLHTPAGPVPSPDHASAWREQSIQALVQSVDAARENFNARSGRVRLALGLMKLLQEFMVREGYKGLDWDRHPMGTGMLHGLISLLRGHSDKDVRAMGALLRKLNSVQLNALLENVHAYFHSMPTDIRADQDAAQAKIMIFVSSLADDEDSVFTVRTSLAQWLMDYVTEILTPLDEADLWEIWYTRSTPFPSALLNPSTRATLLAGLLRPHDFGASTSPSNTYAASNQPLWELPDTSILFRRYSDSGRMINVYDWYESFKTVLETQRRKATRHGHNGADAELSPRKRKGLSAEGGDAEKWRAEVQARFVRALHELDYLGFVKHTTRKADHVLRTVFDIAD